MLIGVFMMVAFIGMSFTPKETERTADEIMSEIQALLLDEDGAPIMVTIPDGKSGTKEVNAVPVESSGALVLFAEYQNVAFEEYKETTHQGMEMTDEDYYEGFENSTFILFHFFQACVGGHYYGGQPEYCGSGIAQGCGWVNHQGSQGGAECSMYPWGMDQGGMCPGCQQGCFEIFFGMCVIM